MLRFNHIGKLLLDAYKIEKVVEFSVYFFRIYLQREIGRKKAESSVGRPKLNVM